jgi:nucleotide-binding universal stress UspA family protein
LRFERVIFTGHPPTPNRALDWATRLAAVHGAKLETVPSEALPAAGRDLVVVERQHRLTAILPASLQHKMLARGSGAVLLVPIGAAPLPEAPPLFRRVLCAVDFHDTLGDAVALAGAFGGSPEKITVLNVVSDVFPGEYAHGRYHFAPDQLEPHLEAQARETLQRLAGQNDPRFELVVASGKPPREIEQRAAQQAPDLLVLAGPFDTPTLHHVASHVACALLFVPPSPSAAPSP